MRKKNPLKYYFVGTQVALTVLASVFIGYQIDKFFHHEKYTITLVCSILSILTSLLVLIRDVNKQK
ncbi:MAG: hypothetical protein CMP62_00635 [Flavobacteriales bacterium]|nr:hypothetical protein [Flavobacteriales bacterium]